MDQKSGGMQEALQILCKPLLSRHEQLPFSVLSDWVWELIAIDLMLI